MLLEFLLSASIDAIVDLAVRIGLEKSVESIKERLLATERTKRKKALDDCLARARSVLLDKSLADLFEQPAVQRELAAVLLDPGENVDKPRLEPFLGNRYPSCVPDLNRYLSALQDALVQDPVWGPIISPVREFRYQKQVLQVLQQINQKLEPRQIVDAVSQHFSGPVTQGRQSPAAEKIGAVVYGDLNISYVVDKMVHTGAIYAAGNPRQRYLVELAREANRLPWAPIHEGYGDAQTGEALDLVEIFTELDTTELERIKNEEDYRHFLLKDYDAKKVPALAALDRFERLLILGDPGAGKTTLVKYLVYNLAQAGKETDGEEWLKKLEPWNHGKMFPIWLEMRRFSAWDGCKKGATHASCLLNYLQQICKELNTPEFSDELKSLIIDGQERAVFIFDGLDEVAKEQRQWVMNVVNDFVDHYRQHRYLATCRPYAYLGQPWHLQNFHQVSLAPFSLPQVDKFISQWYDRLQQHRRFKSDEAEHRCNDLQRVVKRKDLAGLAQRPLLLTIMANLHAFRGKLPDDRTELYADAVKLLLERWERGHHQQNGILEFINIPNLKMDDLEAALYESAFYAHSSADPQQPTADLAEELLLKIVKKYLAQDYKKAEQFVEYIRERAGLLIRHKNEAYTFPHRTFQEYLAACYLVNQPDYAQHMADLLKKDWDRWREVYVLACGRARRSGKLDAAILSVTKLCHSSTVEKQSKTQQDFRFARLAGEGLYEAGLLGVQRSEDGRALLKRVQDWLVESMGLPQFLPAPDRAEAGVVLSRIGDPRKHIMTVADMQFSYVPAGTFIMGSEKDKSSFDDEQPQHEVKLKEYWIATQPVSQAQFRIFEQEGGYQNPADWAEAIQLGLWKEGKFTRTLYKLDDMQNLVPDVSEIASSHYSFGTPYEMDNHPVVGISWYEALAFCRWLTRVGHDQQWLPADWQVMLPSEAEWEKASRGGNKVPVQPVFASMAEFALKSKTSPALTKLCDNKEPARIYSWTGKTIDSNRANYDQTGIKSTSPLGCFSDGKSPYGCEDMCGNVWEWTRSLWGSDYRETDANYRYPYQPGDDRERITEPPQVWRVVRGGSFGSSSQGVRCAYRSRSSPDLRSNDLGFRVVLLPF